MLACERSSIRNMKSFKGRCYNHNFLNLFAPCYSTSLSQRFIMDSLASGDSFPLLYCANEMSLIERLIVISESQKDGLLLFPECSRLFTGFQELSLGKL